jgi:DNA-binding beta-propeller fold protein YncE
MKRALGPVAMWTRFRADLVGYRWVMRRGWIGVALAAVIVLAGVAAGIWVGARRPGPPATGSGAAAPASPVVARVPVPGKPRQLVADADGLWVVADAGLHRIDPATNQVVVSVPVGPPDADLGGLGLSATAAWVPQERSELLWRVDRATNRVRGRVELGQVLYGPVGVATQGGTVWVACCGLKYGARPAGTLLRVDGRRGQVTGRFAVPEGPMAVAADPDGVWVGTAAGSLLRVDPVAAKVVARVAAPDPRGPIQAVSLAPGVLWVADTGAGAIRRFDLASGRYTLAVTAPAPRNLAAGPDGAYVVTDLNQLLSRVDAGTGRRGRPLPLAQLGGVRGIAVRPDAVWVTTGDQVVRLDPARIPA